MAACSFYPQAFNKELGESKLADFIEYCRDQQVTDIVALFNKNNHRDLLSAVFSNSPYLSRLLTRDVHFTRRLLSEDFDVLFEEVIRGLSEILPVIKDIKQIMRHLRLAKARVALITSFADLSGAWPLEVITDRLTEFAEVSVGLTVSHLIRAEMIKGNLAIPQHLSAVPIDQFLANRDLSKNTGYVVLAMGKMGGFELNYSSDIDLIVLYDNDIDRRRICLSGSPGIWLKSCRKGRKTAMSFERI